LFHYLLDADLPLFRLLHSFVVAYFAFAFQNFPLAHDDLIVESFNPVLHFHGLFIQGLQFGEIKELRYHQIQTLEFFFRKVVFCDFYIVFCDVVVRLRKCCEVGTGRNSLKTIRLRREQTARKGLMKSGKFASRGRTYGLA
jgi:hypothetical protein